MTESKAVIIHTPEEWRETALEMVGATRKRLLIFTPDMEPNAYNTRHFMEATLNILKRSRQTEVKIITQETKLAIEIEHRLLQLFRYSDTQFQIKTLSQPADSQFAAYLIGDDHYLLRRQSADEFRALCYTGDRPRTRNQIEEFDQLWRFAVPDPGLRRLTI